MRRLCSTIILIIILAGATYSQAEVYKQIRIAYPDEATFLKILKSGIEPIYGQAGQYIDFAVNEQDLQKFNDLSIPYTGIHDDLTAYYQSRNPLGTTMGGYRVFSEIVAVMDSFSAAYPQYCTPKYSIATTEQGRSLWVEKISDNPGTDEDEPEVFISGIIHAREPIGGEIILEFMRFLLTQYGSDPIATNLVNNYQLYFLPVINPDGYEYNRQIAPNGGGMWRKNRRNNWDGQYGVDLNRNFSYFWGYDDDGSSPNTGDETYRGPSYASEPEVLGIQNFVNSHRFAMVLNYHAYGDDFLYSWGYYDGVNDDVAYYDTLSNYIRSIGYVVGTPWQVLFYHTNGDIVDWSYGDDRSHKKCFGEVVEVGTGNDGFWPAQNRIAPLVAENINFMKDFLPRAIDVYHRRLPQMPTITGPSVAAPGSQFYLHWQRSNVDTFNLATRYRVTTLADYSRSYQTFEDPAGIELNGFTRSTAYRHSGNYSAYSGQGNNLRNYVTLTERTKVQAGEALTFWARYNIQAGYDYAYVQVSTDGGVTWYEINGTLSTSDNPHHRNKGYGITGTSNGNWVLGTYNLNAYVGREIKVRFAYWTDGATSNEGIYIDDVYPSDLFGTKTVLADFVGAESLLVGPFAIGQRWFEVEGIDADGQYSPPSNRFLVDIQGNIYTLSGHVALSDSPADLSGSMVNIVGAGLSGSTNSAGDYSILNVPQGSYDIIGSHPGYYPDTVYAFTIGSDTTLDFNLAQAPPLPPSLLSPTDNATLDTEYVDFDWNDVASADRYVIEIAGDQNFDSIISFDSTLTSSSYHNVQPFANDTYYWRVTAHSSLGYAERSSVWRFTVNVSLSAPNLVSPSNGFVSNESYVDFDWSDVNRATRYAIEIALDDQFNNVVERDSTLTASVYMNQAAFPNATYYWRVTAFAPGMTSPRSSVRTFSVNVVLAQPILQYPPNGIITDTTHVDFNWDDVTGADLYIIEFALNRQFSPIVMADSSLAVSHFTNGTPFGSNEYFWRVRATDGTHWSPYSDTWSVIINTNPNFLPGDANGSGFVTGLDIVYLVNFIKGAGPAPTPYLAGDANGSCTVTGLDALYLVSYFKGGPLPVRGNCLTKSQP